MRKRNDRSPKCPLCKTKFAHNSETLTCGYCGLPDEMVSRGVRAVKRWGITHGVIKPGISTSTRRRLPHGRNRGGCRPLGGTFS